MHCKIRKYRPTEKHNHKWHLYYRAIKSGRHVKVRRRCIGRLIREKIHIREQHIRITRI